MKALTSPDVLKLWKIARRDKRLNKADRVILAAVARDGHVGSLRTLAQVAQLKNIDAARARLKRLVDAGYLPTECAK